mgnify:CR=1 FL=1
MRPAPINTHCRLQLAIVRAELLTLTWVGLSWAQWRRQDVELDGADGRAQRARIHPTATLSLALGLRLTFAAHARARERGELGRAQVDAADAPCRGRVHDRQRAPAARSIALWREGALRREERGWQAQLCAAVRGRADAHQLPDAIVIRTCGAQQSQRDSHASARRPLDAAVGALAAAE